ncbi:MAG TPA: glycosyltransferase family 61 protein [Paracoccus sp. (in: a-proteobacteria)]|uniref:glycosyltransferase family 61 protein n=1 Tax=Paracoccus sp. TaxID=267 RepID=UPI002B8942A4|nr:glycosyltransferase family 61 protein [Paracoccus sp. (in: a-proteobacteria)]HWL58445.1 glycosyltransferase family 61 protein [Paracoccus sp. (in: a-proteobacteria)]
MLNTALISRNLARLLRRGSSQLSDFATERQTICPAEETSRPPALYPEGAMERITALSPWRDWEVERGLIEGSPVEHAATEALLVPDVVLAGAYIYRGGAKERVGIGPARMLDPALPPALTLPEAHLVSTWTGADFFGNFIQDSLPLELIPKPDQPCIGAPTKPYLHEAGYRDLLDLPAPPMPGHARVARLTLYRDFSQNSYKVARYEELRSRLRAHLGPARPARGVFLRRGTAHGEPRRLVNEDALAELLEREGFDIIAVEETSAAEILRRALDAPVVVAVEGSHFSHAIYTLAKGGSFLVIQPPDRFAMPYKEYADCMGMKFGFVVGLPSGTGFAVDLDEIKPMLERLT